MTDPNDSFEGGAERSRSAEDERSGGTADEATGPTGACEVSNAEPNELPADVVEEAERLTRLERTLADEVEADVHAERRADLLEDHEFTARIRDDDGDDVLVLHPQEWHDEAEGVIRTDRIDDISRAVEIPLEGAGDPDDWDAVETHNRDLVAQVRTDHGDVHGDNAALLADFAGNHYAKRIESLTSEELTEFRVEYVVRNAWPSEAQRDALEDSIALVLETTDEPVPELQDW